MKKDSNSFHITPPPADLADTVCAFWEMKADPSAGKPLPFRVMADGRPGILIPGKTTSSKSSVSKAVLYGQTTGYDDLYFEPGVQLFGVVFHSHVLRSLFGFDADEVTNQIVELDLLLPKPVDWTSLFRINGSIITVLRELKEQQPPADHAIQKSIEIIHSSGGTISLTSLHKSLQLSERQFERRFKQHTGVPPILFMRITRFQSALKQVKEKRYKKLSDVAFDHGYSDQSHFSREFREFSGFRPVRYHSPERNNTELCRM